LRHSHLAIEHPLRDAAFHKYTARTDIRCADVTKNDGRKVPNPRPPSVSTFICLPVGEGRKMIAFE